MFLSWTEWKAWTKTYPWSLRWLIFLILLRPAIDNLYFLKDISPILSPLYWVGLLTPILTINAFSQIKHRLGTGIDFMFRIWMFLGVFSAFFYLYYDIDLLRFVYQLFKVTMIFYIYFLFRLFIRDIDDVWGVIQTAIYSSVVILGLFAYEMLVNPIYVEYSRGLQRIQGNFGDIANYAFYTNFMLLFAYYHWFRFKGIKTLRQRLIPVLVVASIGLAILFNINHAASFIIFTFLTLLFILRNFRENFGAALLLAGVVILLVMIFKDTVLQNTLEPIFAKDIDVFEGDEDTRYLMHGRVGRWENFIDDFSNTSILAQLFGVTLAFIHPTWYILATTGSGIHNDYLRVLAQSGYFGFFTFIFILLGLFFKIRRLRPSESFLAFGSLFIYGLYAVTMTPTVYPVFLYFFLPIFVFAIRTVK